MAYPDILLHIPCPAAPLIIEGIIGGQSVYYRSRHQKWALNINDEFAVSGTDGEIDDDSQKIVVAMSIIMKACENHIWDQINTREDELYDKAMEAIRQGDGSIKLVF